MYKGWWEQGKQHGKGVYIPAGESEEMGGEWREGKRIRRLSISDVEEANRVRFRLEG